MGKKLKETGASQGLLGAIEEPRPKSSEEALGSGFMSQGLLGAIEAETGDASLVAERAQSVARAARRHRSRDAVATQSRVPSLASRKGCSAPSKPRRRRALVESARDLESHGLLSGLEAETEKKAAQR